MTSLLPASEVREAIRVALPAAGARYAGEEVPSRNLYVPAAHARALSPDTMLVRGIRGAGKTLWWQALQDPALREVVVACVPRAGLEAATRVVAGFGPSSAPDRYPDRDAIGAILRTHEPRTLWRTIFLHAVAKGHPGLPRVARWQERVDHVAAHPEDVARVLDEVDRRQAERGEITLVVFDALDRTARPRNDLVEILRGLLEVLVETRDRRALRAKVFVRPDLLEDPRTRQFPDASKLLADAVDLRWSPTDLYGLFFQHLGNARTQHGQDHPGARAVRRLSASLTGQNWQGDADRWALPDALRRDAAQERLLPAITGQWMGADHRRGFVYSWLPKHLADGRQQVSPRSFLVALHAAAEQTPPEHELPLSWRALRLGVTAASRVRVEEIVEDHPWVEPVKDALASLTVPVDPGEILGALQEHRVVDAIRSLHFDEGTLPRHLDAKEEGLVKDLIDLGVFHLLRNGRIQVPDVYRVDFGMGRKGGVPAVR